VPEKEESERQREREEEETYVVSRNSRVEEKGFFLLYRQISSEQ
jgi:hypothetical protein